MSGLVQRLLAEVVGDVAYRVNDRLFAAGETCRAIYPRTRTLQMEPKRPRRSLAGELTRAAVSCTLDKCNGTGSMLTRHEYHVKPYRICTGCPAQVRILTPLQQADVDLVETAAYLTQEYLCLKSRGQRNVSDPRRRVPQYFAETAAERWPHVIYAWFGIDSLSISELSNIFYDLFTGDERTRLRRQINIFWTVYIQFRKIVNNPQSDEEVFEIKQNEKYLYRDTSKYSLFHPMLFGDPFECTRAICAHNASENAIKTAWESYSTDYTPESHVPARGICDSCPMLPADVPEFNYWSTINGFALHACAKRGQAPLDRRDMWWSKLNKPSAHTTDVSYLCFVLDCWSIEDCMNVWLTSTRGDNHSYIRRKHKAYIDSRGLLETSDVCSRVVIIFSMKGGRHRNNIACTKRICYNMVPWDKFSAHPLALMPDGDKARALAFKYDRICRACPIEYHQWEVLMLQVWDMIAQVGVRRHWLPTFDTVSDPGLTRVDHARLSVKQTLWRNQIIQPWIDNVHTEFETLRHVGGLLRRAWILFCTWMVQVLKRGDYVAVTHPDLVYMGPDSMYHIQAIRDSENIEDMLPISAYPMSTDVMVPPHPDTPLDIDTSTPCHICKAADWSPELRPIQITCAGGCTLFVHRDCLRNHIMYHMFFMQFDHDIGGVPCTGEAVGMIALKRMRARC
jgi:hypothetical protein